MLAVTVHSTLLLLVDVLLALLIHLSNYDLYHLKHMSTGRKRQQGAQGGYLTRIRRQFSHSLVE